MKKLRDIVERVRSPERAKKLLNYIANHHNNPNPGYIHFKGYGTYPYDYKRAIRKDDPHKTLERSKATVDPKHIEWSQPSVDAEKVSTYIDKLSAGENAPNIHLIQHPTDRTKFQTPDGHHRILAAKLLGKKINADVWRFRSPIKRAISTTIRAGFHVGNKLSRAMVGDPIEAQPHDGMKPRKY